MSQEK